MVSCSDMVSFLILFGIKDFRDTCIAPRLNIFAILILPVNKAFDGVSTIADCKAGVSWFHIISAARSSENGDIKASTQIISFAISMNSDGVGLFIASISLFISWT